MTEDILTDANEDGFPDSPADPHHPDAVFLLHVQATIQGADKYNADQSGHYFQWLANAKENWRSKAIKIPLPACYPALQRNVAVSWSERTITISYGPEKVVRPLPVMPWDEVPVEPAEGEYSFGPPISDYGDFARGFWDGGSNVEPGFIALHGGRQYRFHVIGQPGTLIYRRMWLPVEA